MDTDVVHDGQPEVGTEPQSPADTAARHARAKSTWLHTRVARFLTRFGAGLAGVGIALGGGSFLFAQVRDGNRVVRWDVVWTGGICLGVALVFVVVGWAATHRE